MKRASYREAVAWIASNDDAANAHSADEIAEYVTTLLIADLFRLDPAKVAADILKYRNKQPSATSSTPYSIYI